MGFHGVSEAVWNYHIGAYQVCEKWLKDRKGRKLSEDEITHYQRIVVALSATTSVTKEIDQVIVAHGGWPGAFQSASPEMTLVTSVRPGQSLPESAALLDYDAGAGADAGAFGGSRSGGERRSIAEDMDDSSERLSIEALVTHELMALIRQFVSQNQPIEREAAIRGLASELGYKRVGVRFREALDNAIRTAVRRGILGNEGGDLSVFARGVADYERDFLKEQFLASLQGSAWQDRDDAIRGFSRWLGFRRTGPQIDETARSLVNGLIREGRLESDGPNIRRT